MTHRVAWVPFCRFCCLVAVSRGVQRRLQPGIRIAPLYNTAWVRPGPRLSHISGRLLSSSMVFRSRPSGSAGQPGTAPFFNHSVYRFYWGCGGTGGEADTPDRTLSCLPALLLPSLPLSKFVLLAFPALGSATNYRGTPPFRFLCSAFSLPGWLLR